MRTADVTGGKPIAVLLQSISDVSAINPLFAFYDIHGGKREVLFFYFVPDTTRDTCITFIKHKKMALNPQMDCDLVQRDPLVTSTVVFMLYKL
jgi:hypothetical protein